MAEFEYNHIDYRQVYDRAARLRAEALRAILRRIATGVASWVRSLRPTRPTFRQEVDSRA